MKGGALVSFLRTNAAVLIIVNLGNLFNYLFLLMAGRVMTPADYGIFNSLNSLAQIWVTPTVVMPMIAARFTIKLSTTGVGGVKTFFLRSQQGLWAFGAVSFLVGWWAMPAIKGYLHIESTTLFVLTFAYVIVAVLYPMMAGILQGLHRYMVYALSTCGIMFIRLAAGVVLLVMLPWGVPGALLSCIVGVVGALLLGLWSLRDVLRVPRLPLPRGIGRQMVRYAIPVFATTTLVILFSSLDIVLVRHYRPAEEAGFYSTAAVLGRIAFFLPGALLGVLFPSVARSQEEGGSGLGYLWISMGLAGMIGAGLTLLFLLWPEFLIRIMFTEKYVPGAHLLPVIGAGMAILGVANLLFTYYLARSETGFLVPLGASLIAFLVGVELYHDSTMQIALVLLASITGGFLLSLPKAVRRTLSERRNRPAPEAG